MDMMTEKPLITIVIPTYNMGKFLRIAIRSCIDQTYANLQIMICDNASDDDTIDVVNEFDDERIKYFRHEVNKGAIANFNFAIAKSEGQFLKFVEADDWIDNYAIELQLAAFKESPHLGLVSSGKYFVNDLNIITGSHSLRNSRFLNAPYSFYRFILMGNEFGTPSDMMVNLNVVNKEDIYFDPLYETYLNDWDVWFRIARKSPVLILKEKLVFVRRHPGQIGNLQGLNNKDIIACFNMIKKLHTSGLNYFWAVMHFSTEYILRAVIKCVKSGFQLPTVKYLFSTIKVLIAKSSIFKFILSIFYMIIIYPFIIVFYKFFNRNS